MDDLSRAQIGAVKVVVATPCFGGAHPDYVVSLTESLLALARLGISVRPLIRTSSLLSHLRCGLAADFLQLKADVLMWVDADEGFAPQDVASVIFGAANLGGIAGGVYPAKHLKVSAMPWEEIRQAAIDGAPASELPFVGQKLNMQFRAEDVDPERGYVGETKHVNGRRFVRVSHAGTGFLAMTREAIEMVGRKAKAVDGGMKVLFNTEVVDGRFNGEDWYFCDLAAKAGYAIWLDTDCQIDHYGPTAWQGNLAGERLHAFARRASRR